MLPAVLISASLFMASVPSQPAGGKRLSVGSVSPTAAMLEPRSGHTATLLPDGRVLIAGGMRRNQDFYRSAEFYDPASAKFTPAGEMGLARVGHAAVLLRSGKVLIAGGWIGHGATDSAELFDPSTGKFTPIAHMTSKRGQPTATLLPDGDVLLAGGGDHDSPGGIASAEIYHAATQMFQPLPNMHEARISHTATLLGGGRVLIAGGRGDAVTASAEIYDSKTHRFTLTGSLHTAGLLPDGRVLIAGGSDERDWHGALANAEIYDPRAGTFSVTSSLNESRFKLPASAVVLPSGGVLIAGGSRFAEVYNSTTGRFSPVSGDMTDAWHFMTETRLKDGTVLLAGGYANNDRATADAWLYRP
jgi:hypothetical protein